MDINDEKHSAAMATRQEVAQLNAKAVVDKLQAFEARLGAQDLLIRDLQAKLQAVEQRLSLQASIGGAIAAAGGGPTTR